MLPGAFIGQDSELVVYSSFCWWIWWHVCGEKPDLKPNLFGRW